ncbi:MAG: amidohydrolase/deacetylase family metallohydrolase [Alphaproteobacteria bacterium]|nr:amidohydrolase/deacetylase family metallohydrolase [Alphaproteobacteria bacterium]
MAERGATILKNGHVIDPAQNIDGPADVAIADGKIIAAGRDLHAEGAAIVDLSGHYVTPGWIDLHVHAYGSLGFSDPDSIGIYQGVTSMVDAGGPGVRTMDEFVAFTGQGLATDVYAGPHIFPLGIIGLEYVETEDDVRGIEETGVAPWREWLAAHPGVVRFLKVGAYSPHGSKPIDIAKETARALSLPLYVHIGENHAWPQFDDPFEHAIRTTQAGDIVTHMYHGCVQGRIIDKSGKLLPVVAEAAGRGVLFDIGMGSYGFAWDVAERVLAQGLRPKFISSDLQQFNVLNPAFSLANVMSICLRLGLPLAEVIEDVTKNPAEALSLSDRAGSLRPGLPADITVFKLERGRFDLVDCVTRKREADTRIVPTMAFKAGRRVDCDLARAQDERNWFMQVAEDHVPNSVHHLSPAQLAFLAALAPALATVGWTGYEPQKLDLRRAWRLQDTFGDVRRAHDLPLRDAMNAVYACFQDSLFPMQIGLFLLRLDCAFAIDRLRQVTAGAAAAA